MEKLFSITPSFIKIRKLLKVREMKGGSTIRRLMCEPEHFFLRDACELPWKTLSYNIIIIHQNIYQNTKTLRGCAEQKRETKNPQEKHGGNAIHSSLIIKFE